MIDLLSAATATSVKVITILAAAGAIGAAAELAFDHED